MKTRKPPTAFLPVCLVLTGLGLVASAAPIVDFRSDASWRPDFGKFVEQPARQLVRTDEGLKILIDHTQDDGRDYGSLVRPPRARVPFAETNRLIRLVARLSNPPATVRRGYYTVKFADAQNEQFQYKPVSIRRLGDLLEMTYLITEDGYVGKTWGPAVNRKWDLPICLTEINWGFDRTVEKGSLTLLRLETADETARDCACVEPLLGFVPDKDAYRVFGAEGALRDDGLHVTFAGRGGWFRYSAFPGAPPFRGMAEAVLETADCPGGSVTLELKEQASGKVVKFSSPWKPVTVFATRLDPSRVYEFHALALHPKNPRATCRITALAGRFLLTAAEACALDVETGSRLRVTTPGRPVDLVLSNRTDRPLAWTGILRLADYFGNGFSVPVAATVEAGGAARIPVGDRVRTKGVWHVSGEIRAGDSVAWPEARFAVLDEHPVTPQWPKGRFRFGVNYHMTRYTKADRELTLDALNAMGAKHVRSPIFSPLKVTGEAQERQPWDWSSSDALLAELEARGLTVDCICYNTPRWAAEPARATNSNWLVWALSLAPNGFFERFCEAAARRYGTRIAYYEIGNEWDLNSPAYKSIDDGIEIQRQAWRGIKRGCPDACVIPNGWAVEDSNGHARIRLKGFQERLMKEARDSYDVHPIHIHGPFKRYVKRLGRFFAMRRRLGIEDKPWYSNETALTSVNGAEDDVAVCVWQKILYAWSRGSVDYIWYNLRGTGYDPRDPEQGYGLISGDFRPRAGMAAFSAVTKTFGELSFEAILHDGEDRQVLRFGGVRQGVPTVVLAGWDEADKAATYAIPVRTDARRGWSVDLMGNRTPIALRDGGFVWTLGALPSAVLLEGATQAVPEAAALARAGVAPQVRLRLSANAATEGRTADVTLATTASVHELYAADPQSAHRTWRGAEDLSARIWFGRTADAIVLRVDVQDDLARQPFAGADMFKGDSVQAVLQIPGQEGLWDIGFSRRDSGAPEVFCHEAPRGFSREALASAVRLDVSRRGETTSYRATLPCAALSLDPARAAAGVRLNVRVYENDGEGCDGWVEWCPGLGEKPDPARFPLLQFLPAAK